MRSPTIASLALVVLAAGPASGATGAAVLDEGSPWRMFATWRTPVVRAGTELKEAAGAGGGGLAARTPPPPDGWEQPDFADGSWSRWTQNRGRGFEYDAGFANAKAPSPSLSLLCLRGRFSVDDPSRAAGLSLSLAYRGGVVVYLNGQEVARASLPKDGKVAPEVPAEDYPQEAFVHSDAPRNGSNCILAEFGHPQKYKSQVEKRIRRLENLAIDPRLLRKGVNVLAVEIHRAPYSGHGLALEGMNHPSVWSTAGLVSLTLCAEGGVTPGVRRPAGIQVWAGNVIRRPSPLDYGDPLDKAQPVRIAGCRNGAFDGRVMVTSDQPLAGVRARIGDLRHGDGKSVVPAGAVKLFYTTRDDRMTMRYSAPKSGFWDSLSEEPPARVEAVPGAGACQSIVLKVRVPVDATPGVYSGKVTVSAEGLSATDVPVELQAAGWTLPDPKQFATHMGVIQSPDTVAIQYKVPLWSEEHWKYMEESFRLLGEVGNNYVVVPIISRTNFGNEQSMVRWVKDGDGYRQDFAIFDRYLDLAQKYQTVDVVCLYGFEQYAGSVQAGKFYWTQEGGKKAGLKVTQWDPKTGKSEDLEGPAYDSPEEFRKFWGPAYREIAARLAKRGLADAMMLGISGDYGGGGQPPKELSALYRELLPGAKWIANPHADCRGGNMGGIPIGYNTQYYLNLCPPPEGGKRLYGWQTKTDYHARNRGPTTPLSCWRTWIEATLVHNMGGRGRVGADFWPVLGNDWHKEEAGKKFPGGREKKSSSIAARYPESDWCQLNLDRGTEAILAPGPRGAEPTENFEQMRMGIQECQARIFLEKAILGKKLDPELARKCQELLDERLWRIRNLGSVGGQTSGDGLNGQLITAWYEGAGSAGLDQKLYAAAAAVSAGLGSK